MKRKEKPENKIELLEKQLFNEKETNNMLVAQQRQFKTMAEKAGSELAELKHKYLRLEEKMRLKGD